MCIFVVKRKNCRNKFGLLVFITINALKEININVVKFGNLWLCLTEETLSVFI